MPQFQDPPQVSWKIKGCAHGVISHLCSFEGRIWREKEKRQQQDRREREKTREADDGRMPRYGRECPDMEAGLEAEEKGIRKDGGCRLVGTESRNEAEGRRKRRTR